MFKKSLYFLLTLYLVNSPLQAASDLDDGIDATDSIEDSILIKKNIQYIIRDARSKGQQAELEGESSSQKGLKKGTLGCGSTGSQTFGPGTNLKGATIVNLSNNKGATSVCAK